MLWWEKENKRQKPKEGKQKLDRKSKQKERRKKEHRKKVANKEGGVHEILHHSAISLLVWKAESRL